MLYCAKTTGARPRVWEPGRKGEKTVMVVVDIRNVFAVRNVELIEVNQRYIYYAEEKNEEGHNNLFLLEYNRASRRERIVATYSLDDPTFVQHIFSFENSILLLLENGGSTVWLFRVDKLTGDETARLQLNCIGAFGGCCALDENHVLIETAPSDVYASLFADYKKVTGCSHMQSLYDIGENANYLVKNELLRQLRPEDIRLARLNGASYALLLNPYGDEALKQKCYRDARWINGEIRDNIWLCPVEDLIQGIQSGAEQVGDLALKLLVSAGTEGMARYVDQDDTSVYFRVKHFPTGRETLCSCPIEGGSVQVLCDLPARDGVRYLMQSGRVYAIEEQENSYVVQGISGSTIHAEYERRLGELIGCVENRFLITRHEEYDPEERSRFTLHTIYDSKRNTEESFECKCEIDGNTLILY